LEGRAGLQRREDRYCKSVEKQVEDYLAEFKGPAVAYEIPKALYEKAEKQQAELTDGERDDRDDTLGNFMNIASLSEVPGNQQANSLVFARHLYPEGYAAIVNPCTMARPGMMLHMIAPGFDKAGPPRSASPKSTPPQLRWKPKLNTPDV
jgi:hypothetical protein